MDTQPPLKISPMMAQWHACKKEAQGAIVLFQLGEFYEAFYEDAELLSKELNLTLTKRQDVPMSGVPCHTYETYVDRLVAKGYRVAIVEQVEDARLTQGLVKRKIVRMVTPGTVVNSTLLSEKTNNFLACLVALNTSFGLAILDLTTADFRVLQFEDKKELIDELSRLAPSELLLCASSSFLPLIQGDFSFTLTKKEDWYFDHRTALEKLLKHFNVHTLDGFGLKGMTAAINAAGSLLTYVSEELNLNTSHLTALNCERLSKYMALDQITQRHLELVHPLHEGNKSATLLAHLDQTLTPMGGRLLRQWLLHPLLAPAEIQKRQEAIGTFLIHSEVTGRLETLLGEIRDLERLIMRIETGYCSPRDLASLRLSLEQITPLSSLLTPLSSSLIQEEKLKLVDISSLIDLLKSALVESPPFRLSEGDIFKKGYHAELDELRALKSDTHAWIAAYQTKLRETTHIKTLKVGYTKAFGYYIEVSRGAAEKMPLDFQRRQTLINAERFTSTELKIYEHKVLSAEERMQALECELFHLLRKEVASQAQTIRTIAEAIARIDCLFSLSKVARRFNYARPRVDESASLHIIDGRHPVIEGVMLQEKFIPNDTFFDEKKERLLLITGPNMAGKSTFIRQVALIVILAHIGSYVPARSAHIGIIDKVFSRIGASDDLARGQSTFMVEMSETANILHHATERSLIILDEIGRGTSTYDGISIAWAVAEYLLTHKEKAAKTLFATHYYELTALETKLAGAVNYNVAIHESSQGITFLRKIVKGSADKSYGIHVARLAGLPLPVIKRAQEMLLSLEKKAAPTASKKNQEQLDIFSAPSPPQKIVDELRGLNLDQLTPLQALQKLIEWKEYV
jgi:DNA mismatch repair protein MutS